MVPKNPWDLDIQEAKREMKLSIFRMWVYALLLLTSLLLAMMAGVLGANLRIESDSFILLLVTGGGFAFIPSLFIGARRWLASDAQRIWKQSEVVVAAVLQSATSTARLLNIRNGKAFSPWKYWLGIWTTYWTARDIAVEALRNTGTLVEVSPLLSNLSGTEVAVSTSEADDFMHRPREWYELVIATIGVVAFSLAFIGIALRL